MRVESTITESNGSSSMASVCGGCLAMLDAGGWCSCGALLRGVLGRWRCSGFKMQAALWLHLLWRCTHACTQPHAHTHTYAHTRARAGVPLLQPVAGIAMGLLLDTDTKKFVVLSDILGGWWPTSFALTAFRA